MKRASGNGQYAKVTITLEPGKRDSGVVFESTIKGGVVPKEFIPAVEKDIRNAATSGPFSKYGKVPADIQEQIVNRWK